MSNNTVSIIIPNYNRAHLISETLDTICLQTYKNWECIVVDDRSTDNSVEIIQKHLFQDERFRLFVRPENYPKGANACRNIGLQKAKGKYIIFFDSDDLMLPDHLGVKINTIQNGNYDFIVAKSEYFNNSENINPMNYRDIEKLPITADNFIMKKINWITFDPIIKSEIAKSISFTEKNESAEEYNYFVKLVLITQNAFFLNQILTKRRFHKDSYQFNLNNDKAVAENKFHYYWDTYSEVKKQASHRARKFMMKKLLEVIYQNKLLMRESKTQIYYAIIKEFGLLKGLTKIKLIEFKK
jgi:glycosyltransferase involved in cell wall biosynthesis